MPGTRFADFSGGLVIGRPLIRRVLGGAAALMAGLTMAQAQAVEQHPAPVLHGAQTASITASALETKASDATRLGPDLSGVMVVDAHANGGTARAKTGAGVDTSLAGMTAQNASFRAILQKYVGRPLSYQLIGQIEADITQFYRDHGRSLVQVTVPPQEVTSGVLQVNVNTFVLEETAVQGVVGGAQGYVASQIRVKPGQEVNTSTLLEDVNWLNLNPFRHVSVVFEPGKAADSTRLTLQVQNGRPWSAYAGASNSGTNDTGIGRIFTGFNMSALPWQDHQLSYQFNGAPGGIAKGDLWDTHHDKGYLSHALSYFVPITTNGGFRMKATLGASHISSYSVPGGPFTSSTTTNGATAELSFPLPRMTGDWTLLPEVFLGLATNSYDRTQYVFGFSFDHEKTDLQHVQLGLRSSLNGKLFGKTTRGNFEVSVSAGQQVTNAAPQTHYSYFKASVAQEVMIDKDRSVALRFGGQYSPDNLHPLEQLSLGGEGTVRGYPSNAVPSQSAASFSVEYRAAPYSVPVGKATGQFRPHVFADVGFADKTTISTVSHLASVGLGGEFSVGENFVAKIDVAQTLVAAGSTDKGTVSVALQVTARF